MPETQKLDHPEVNRDESGTVVDAAGEPLGEVAAALFGDFEDADFADAAPVIEQLDQSERDRAALDEKIDDLESGGRAGTHEHTHELANHDATWGTVEGERGSEAQHALADAEDHYHENRAGYEQQALEDAQRAGVEDITFGEKS